MDKKPEGQKSLEMSDIEEIDAPSRRSALSTVGALIATAVFGAAVSAPSESEACPRRTGRTDSDPSDGVNRGRTGITDSDTGRRADSPQCGRRSAPAARGCTDSDTGSGADTPGHGRHC
jgi:hypothetical protein